MKYFKTGRDPCDYYDLDTGEIITGVIVSTCELINIRMISVETTPAISCLPAPYRTITVWRKEEEPNE